MLEHIWASYHIKLLKSFEKAHIWGMMLRCPHTFGYIVVISLDIIIILHFVTSVCGYVCV